MSGRWRAAGDALRSPGVPMTLALSLITRIPAGALGVLLVLRTIELGKSYAASGLCTAAYAGGLSCGAPLVGRFIDRFGHTRVLGISGVSAAASCATFAALGRATPAVALVGAAALIGLTFPPVAASARATWSHRLERGAYAAVVTVESVLQEIIYMLGPAMLLYMATFAGPGPTLVVSGVAIAAPTVAYSALPATRGMPPARRQDGRPVGALASPALRTVFACTLMLGLCFGAIEIGVVAFANARHVRDSVWQLLIAWSMGSLLGGLAVTWRPPRHPAQLLGRLLRAFAVTSVALALAPNAEVLGLALVISGVAIAPTFAVLNMVTGAAAGAGSLTEAFALQTTGLSAGLAVGSAAGGAIASTVTPAASFLLAVAAALAGSCVHALRRGTLPRAGD